MPEKQHQGRGGGRGRSRGRSGSRGRGKGRGGRDSNNDNKTMGRGNNNSSNGGTEKNQRSKPKFTAPSKPQLPQKRNGEKGADGKFSIIISLAPYPDR